MRRAPGADGFAGFVVAGAAGEPLHADLCGDLNGAAVGVAYEGEQRVKATSNPIVDLYLFTFGVAWSDSNPHKTRS